MPALAAHDDAESGIVEAIGRDPAAFTAAGRAETGPRGAGLTPTLMGLRIPPNVAGDGRVVAPTCPELPDAS